jgi:uncharacterized protein (DUF1499 family)
MIRLGPVGCIVNIRPRLTQNDARHRMNQHAVSPKTRKRLMTALVILAVVLLALFPVLAFQVDDWSRDLTTNHAETSLDAGDQALRPLSSNRSVDETAAAIERAAKTLPRWTFEGRTDAGDVATLRFIRATKLFGFKDDITLRVEPSADGVMIHATSQSRVGKGDLGQNPRNLKEILGAVSEQLDATSNAQ